MHSHAQTYKTDQCKPFCHCDCNEKALNNSLNFCQILQVDSDPAFSEKPYCICPHTCLSRLTSKVCLYSLTKWIPPLREAYTDNMSSENKPNPQLKRNKIM